METIKNKGAFAALTGRNLKIFFRDKTSVFFSLLAVLIIIALYAFFLGDVLKEGLPNVDGAGELMNSWIIAGILAVISMTSTLGAFGVMVEDRARKMYKDFDVSPIGRGAISGGYVASAYCVGVIMSLVALVIGEIYIVASGGAPLSPEAVFMAVGTILLSVLASSAIVFFIVSFFKTMNAYSTASTVIGTLIGFLTGMYINIGSLPEGVQSVIKAFPVSYSAVMFRNIFMEKPMAEVFSGAPAGVVTDFKLSMGVEFSYGEYTSGTLLCVIVLLCTAALFYLLALANMSRKRKV